LGRCLIESLTHVIVYIKELKKSATNQKHWDD
jgi:hypothetical protein